MTMTGKPFGWAPAAFGRYFHASRSHPAVLDAILNSVFSKVVPIKDIVGYHEGRWGQGGNALLQRIVCAVLLPIVSGRVTAGPGDIVGLPCNACCKFDPPRESCQAPPRGASKHTFCRMWALVLVECATERGFLSLSLYRECFVLMRG